MANSRLSFVIAIKLLTENFNKGATAVKSQLMTMQRQFLALASAIGAGTIGFSGLVSKMVQTAKETSRATIALKNVTASTAEFADAQRWLIDLSKRYGVGINTLTTSFAKFKAAADISNMTMEDQRKIFESVARATVAFGLSSEDQKGVFMALQQMMSKNKVMAEELRLQLAERMPVAIQAMAKAAGVTVGELDTLMKQGKVLSSEVLPKFAEVLNSMIQAPDTDNLNKSLIDLQNTFTSLTKSLNVEGIFKGLVDGVNSMLQGLAENINIVFTAIKVGATAVLGKGLSSIMSGYAADYDRAVSAAVKAVEGGQRAINRVTKAKADYDLAVAERSKALAEQQAITVATSAEEQMRINARVAAANKAVKDKETAHFKACENQKKQAAKVSAAEQALAAQQGAQGWTRFSNILKFSIGNIAKTFGAFLKTNLYTAAFTLFAKLTKSVYDLAKAYIKLKSARDDAFKEIASASSAEAGKLDILRQNFEIGKAYHIRAAALEEINSLLGTEYKLATLTKEAYDEINKSLLERAKIALKQEQLNNAVRKKAENDARISQLAEKSASLKVGRIGPFAFNYGGLTRNETAEYKQLLEENKGIDDWINANYGKGLSITSEASRTPSRNVSAVEMEDNKEEKELERKALEYAMQETPDEDKIPINLKRRVAALMAVSSVLSRQRDKSGDWKMSDLEIKQADLAFEEDKLAELRGLMEEYGIDLGSALSEGMAKTTNLKQAINFQDAQDSLAEFQKQMRENSLSTLESGLDGLTGALGRLKEALDEDASGWEKTMAIIGAFGAMAEGVIGVIEGIAQAKEIAAQMEKAQAATKVQANAGEAASEVGKNIAKESGGWLALVTVPAAIAAILAAFSSIPKFAQGGIVGGNSTQGDKVLARLNSGEGVLTATGLESLHDASNPRNRRNIHVTGVLRGRGRDLVAVIEQEDHFTKRIGG